MGRVSINAVLITIQIDDRYFHTSFYFAIQYKNVKVKEMI